MSWCPSAATPGEVTTDRAAVDPRVLDELLPGRAAGAPGYRCEHRKVASNARSESRMLRI
jgi:hypothetical protein